MENYYASHGDDENDQDFEPEEGGEELAPIHGSSGGGRTLGGDGVPSRRVAGPPATSSSSAQPSGGARGGMRTLRDLQGSSDPHGHGHGHSHDDSDDDDDDEGQEFFAGGDKSALAVQNPLSAEEQVNRVLKRAARYATSHGTKTLHTKLTFR